MVACHYFRVAAFSRKFLKVAGHKLQRSMVEKNSSSNSVCLDNGRTFLKKKNNAIFILYFYRRRY